MSQSPSRPSRSTISYNASGMRSHSVTGRGVVCLPVNRSAPRSYRRRKESVRRSLTMSRGSNRSRPTRWQTSSSIPTRISSATRTWAFSVGIRIPTAKSETFLWRACGGGRYVGKDIRIRRHPRRHLPNTRSKDRQVRATEDTVREAARDAGGLWRSDFSRDGDGSATRRDPHRARRAKFGIGS